MILEHGQNIEQQPALAIWSWYIGALHQYHSAILIIHEMYAGSYTPAMEQRAWRCLDYAFELSQTGVSNQEKGREVLEELAHRSYFYVLACVSGASVLFNLGMSPTKY